MKLVRHGGLAPNDAEYFVEKMDGGRGGLIVTATARPVASRGKRTPKTIILVLDEEEIRDLVFVLGRTQESAPAELYEDDPDFEKEPIEPGEERE